MDFEKDYNYDYGFDVFGYRKKEVVPIKTSDKTIKGVDKMNKFKIGDRVRVKNDLLVDTFYDDGCKFISDMEYALGKVGVIVRIERNGRYVVKFDCEDYYHSYCYSPSMLEPITNNNLEIYRQGNKCPYDFLNEFWDNFMNRAWAKIVIINNPEVMVIDKDFNIFKARCCRNDAFNPEIGLEICCKKRKINIFENEKEKKAKELVSLERMIKDLKENLNEY